MTSATADTTATTTPHSAAAPAAARQPAPSRPRRAAVAVTGLLACLPGLVWGVAAAVMLATGVEADHRFHQVTGQGVLLGLVWLAGLVPLVRAGLRGRRPSTAAGLHALVVVSTGAAAGALAPQAGGYPVAVYALLTAGLLWLALPLRPRLRGAFTGGLDVVLLPFALLTTALVVPFALGEADLQHAMADEHADMAHYFDMAWLVLALAGLSLVAALSSVGRSLALWTGVGLVVTGAARIAFTPNTTWSVLAIVLGAAGTAAVLARRGPARTAS